MKKIIVLMLLLVLSACGYPRVISKESFDMAVNKCAQSGGLDSLYDNHSGRLVALCLDGSTIQFAPPSAHFK